MENTPTTVRAFFTDAEWDAIGSALADFQDYGETESALVDSIECKIDTLFQETK
jgi:hypothetical protein|tara:strand:- start:59 stop:220 length:162 start_codon:yes stop_codon:yes gene_type:complete